MSEHEFLGLRAKQLNNGADAFIEIPPGMINGNKIALEELNQKKVPFYNKTTYSKWWD